jgi:predicted nucleic acid-binding protein
MSGIEKFVLDTNAVIKLLDDIVIILPDIEIVETAIQIRRKRPTLKLPDAVIAASAIALNAILVTNDDDILKFTFPGLRTMRFE